MILDDLEKTLGGRDDSVGDRRSKEVVTSVEGRHILVDVGDPHAERLDELLGRLDPTRASVAASRGRGADQVVGSDELSCFDVESSDTGAWDWRKMRPV